MYRVTIVLSDGTTFFQDYKAKAKARSAFAWAWQHKGLRRVTLTDKEGVTERLRERAT